MIKKFRWDTSLAFSSFALRGLLRIKPFVFDKLIRINTRWVCFIADGPLKSCRFITPFTFYWFVLVRYSAETKLLFTQFKRYKPTYRNPVWVFLPDFLSLWSPLLERMLFFVLKLHGCWRKSKFVSETDRGVRDVTNASLTNSGCAFSRRINTDTVYLHDFCQLKLVFFWKPHTRKEYLKYLKQELLSELDF